MNTRNKKVIAALLCVALVVAIVFKPGTGEALKLGNILNGKLGSVIKGAAVLVLTDALSGQINSFINTVTLNNGVPESASTKVVPIIALGSGTRVGAAQVTGPKDLVDSTRVVVQIETKFSFKNLDVEVFIPSDSLNPLKFHRVEGVGVSALIDLRTSGL